MFLLSALFAGCSKSPQNYVDTGDEFYQSQKYADAALNYRKAIQQDEQFSAAYRGLGRVAQAQGNLLESVALLRKASELQPDNVALKVELADRSLELLASTASRPGAVYQLAAQIANELLTKDPESFDGLRIKGFLTVADRQMSEAAALFERALRVRAQSSEVEAALGQALIQIGRGEDGEHILRALLEREPEHAPARNALYAYLRANSRNADAASLLQAHADRNPKDAIALLQLAAHHQGVGEPQKSTEIVEKILSNPQAFESAYMAVGNFYQSTGRPNDAFAVIQRCAEAEPGNVPCQRKLIEGYVARQRNDDALAAVEALVRNGHVDDEIRRARAALLLERGNATDADTILEDYKHLASSDPSDPQLRYQLGRAWRLKGDREGAMRELREAIRLRPNYLNAKLALAELYGETGNIEESLRNLEEMLSVDKSNVRLEYLRASALRTAGRYTEARREITRLVRSNPDNKDIELELGLLNLAEKRYAEAEAIFAKHYKPGDISDARPAVGLSEALAAKGQVDAAIRVLSSEASRRPNETGPRLSLATMLLRSGDAKAALAEYEKVLALQPENLEAQISSGLVYFRLGEVDRGLALLRKAAESSPSNTGARLALADGLNLAGKGAEALKEYRAVLDSGQRIPSVLNNVAYLLAKEGGDYDEALRLAQETLRLAPENPNFVDTLGYVYLRRGMTDSAIATFENLVSKQPSNPSFRLHLAQALHSKGDRNAAEKHLRDALAQQPSREVKGEIERLLAQ
jgi:tetratricopeptide (TPR) repeat protein